MSPQNPIRLIPLICLNCQTPLPARIDERAWVCATCQRGMLLASDGTLCAQDIFCSDQIKPGVQGRPYWVASGSVAISERTTYKSDRSKDAQQFWAVPRLFFIPAFEASLDEVVSSAVGMLRSPAQVQPGPPAPFLPVVTPPEDLHALAEFIVYSLEADRKDALKTLKFTVRLDPAQLWVI
jgi:hypothetical protein